MMQKEAGTYQTKNNFHIAERRSGTEEDLSGLQPSSMALGAVVLSEEEDIFRNTPSSAKVFVPETLADALNVIKCFLIDNASCNNILRAVKVSGLLNAILSSKKDQLQSKWFKEASLSVLLLR